MNNKDLHEKTIFKKLKILDLNDKEQLSFKQKEMINKLEDWESINDKISMIPKDNDSTNSQILNCILTDYQKFISSKSKPDHRNSTNYSHYKSTKPMLFKKDITPYQGRYENPSKLSFKRDLINNSEREFYSLKTETPLKSKNPESFMFTPSQKVESSFEKILSLKANQLLDQQIDHKSNTEKKTNSEKTISKKKLINLHHHRESSDITPSKISDKNSFGINENPLKFSEDSGNNHEKNPFFHIINDHKFTKYIKLFKRDNNTINHMTKYLKTVLNISPPNYNDYILIEKATNRDQTSSEQTLNKKNIKIQSDRGGSKSVYTNPMGCTYRYISTNSSFNFSPRFKEKYKDIKNKLFQFKQNKQNLRGKLGQIYNNCDKQLVENEKLLNVSSIGFKRDQDVFKESIDKIFQYKDLKMEKYLAKDYVKKYNKLDEIRLREITKNFIKPEKKWKDLVILKKKNKSFDIK